MSQHDSLTKLGTDRVGADDDRDEELDAAVRLLALAQRLPEEVRRITINNVSGLKSPWWQVASAVTPRMGFETFMELQDTYLLLCRSVLERLDTLQVNRETVRQSWKDSVSSMRGLFDAGSYGKASKDVFAECLSPSHFSTLDMISERFQRDGLTETPRAMLEEAFGAVRDAIEACESAVGIPRPLVKALRHLLVQMEAALSSYELAGDAGFWSLYKEAYGSFVQLHPIIMGVEERDTIVGKIQVVGAKLLLPLSVTSNVVTLGAAAIPLLSGG